MSNPREMKPLTELLWTRVTPPARPPDSPASVAPPPFRALLH